MKDRKGVLTTTLIWIIVGVLILAVVLFMIYYLNKKDISLMEYIQNLFRFRRS